MTAGLPRSQISTVATTLILGPVGGLLWIGRISYAIVLMVIIALPLFAYFAGLTGLPPLQDLAVQGSFWAAYALFLAASLALVLFLRVRSRPHGEISSPSAVVALTLVALAAPVLLALFITHRSFSIPSGSMMPTLLVGDYLFVDTSAYGLGPYSFPAADLLIGDRILAKQPERGDVVVFKFPPDPSIDYIKRIIGLPGDTVQMRGGRVILNGVALEQAQMPDFDAGSRYGGAVKMYREILPGGRSYSVLDMHPSGSADDTRLFEVPDGHYFMLGDNRDNAADSRFAVGFVPFEYLVGKAVWIYLNIEGSPVEERRFP